MHITARLSSLTIVAALTLVGAARAAPSSSALDARLAALASLDDDASYTKARDAFLKDVDPTALVARAEAARFDDDTWRADLMALALVARTTDPAAFTTLSTLTGLDPAHYLKRRRPIPLAGRELANARLPVGALVEAHLHPRLVRGEPKALPAAFSRADVARLRADEERAFKDAVMMALVESGHQAAVPLLLDTGLHAVDAVDRGGALAQVGALSFDARVAPTLSAVLVDVRAPEDARIGAAIGLGKVRTARSVEDLAAVLRDDQNVMVRRAAVGALGNVGNRGAHRAIKRADSDRVRALVADVLIDVLEHGDDDVMREMTVAGLGQSGDDVVVARLETLATSAKDERTAELAAKAARVLARGLARERR